MTEIKITSPDKILFPKDKITKLDVIKYYVDICPRMLPFVKNRILSVIRCHSGIDEDVFFKKHPTNDQEFVNHYPKDDEVYFYVDTLEQIVLQAQFGTLEFHVGARDITQRYPNIMVFDLDPDEKLPLKTLRDSVIKIKTILDELKLKSFLKTSGGKGYHILVPFSKNLSPDDFYDFSRNIAKLAENKWQDLFTTNLKKSERKGKIFIDYLRNNDGSTCVAPYSLRARDGATISFPISWENLYKIKPNEITIKNYKKYISPAWDDFIQSIKK